MIITQYFEADHDRLDLLFGQYKQNLTSDFKLAQSFLECFTRDLTTHIYWEEHILFPLFEKITGVSQGPTMVMCEEHVLIKSMLSNLTALSELQIDEAKRLIEQLEQVLSAHNDKEENVLYPTLDRISNSIQQANVFLAMSQSQQAK